MIHITKYLVSIKLHFVCFLIGFLLFMNIFYFYYFIPMAKRNRESPLKCLQDLVNVIKQDQITRKRLRDATIVVQTRVFSFVIKKRWKQKLVFPVQ